MNTNTLLGALNKENTKGHTSKTDVEKSVLGWVTIHCAGENRLETTFSQCLDKTMPFNTKAKEKDLC